VGIDHDLATFAVESIRRQWLDGQTLPPPSPALGFQSLTRAPLLPPESAVIWSRTNRWNKIEHRLISFISKNWRTKPLVSHEVIAK
jgi:hypothetical protein